MRMNRCIIFFVVLITSNARAEMFFISEEGRSISPISLVLDENAKELQTTEEIAEKRMKQLGLSVSSRMTRSPVFISWDGSAVDAFSKMISHNIRHLPVVNKGKIVGIVSDRDILLAVRNPKRGYEIPEQPIYEMMTKVLIACDESTTIGEAADVMSFYKVDCLPVTTREGVLIGIITCLKLFVRSIKAV